MVATDVEFVRQIAELIFERHLTHVEVRDGSRRIHLGRNTSRLINGLAPTHNLQTFYSSEGAFSDAPGGCDEDLQEIVRSTLVGTAHFVSRANGRGLIRAGDLVEVGDEILSVRTLNISNPIYALSMGVIMALCVEEGQPVEFDQPLFILGRV